ncbi:MAG: GNAT family N-acetyltransferase [Pseudonocardiales bacterium]|nr:MAG: GNAT family N-acetyltransferase [Pseudonocardiales bacterium]
MTEPLPEIVLETERLILRPYTTADAPDVELACNDPATRRWIPLPDPYDDAVARSWVTDLSHRTRLSGIGTTFAVVARDGGRLVASFGLHELSRRNKSAEMGYWVAPWARGHGYGVEAARRIAAYAFDGPGRGLGLGRLEVLVDPANAASHRLAVRAGYSYEGLRLAAGVHGDHRVDLSVWRLLPGDPYPAPRLFPDAAECSDGVVTVRPTGPRDTEGVYAERTDPEYARWATPWGPGGPPRSVEEVRRRLEEVEWRWLSGQMTRFAVIDTASGKYAGSVSVHPKDLVWQVAVVGYAMHPAFRGRGYLRRAVPMVARWAFDDAGLARLEAGIATGNHASVRVAEAIGFRREGVMRRLQPLAGGRIDQVFYGLLPGDLP